MRREVEADITWHAPSGAAYVIPTRLTIFTENDHGADADGNRGVSGWSFEDFELAVDAEELEAIITDPDDLECFDADVLSEDAFEAALDRL